MNPPDSPPALESLQAAFDDLLTRDEVERDAQLRALAATDPARAEQLRRLLAIDEDFETDVRVEPAARLALGDARTDDSVPGYRLLEQIGAGGMGRVYTAVRLDDPKQEIFALKTVRQELASPLIAQRFALECEALASLAHPGIARFIEAGHRQDGTPFVAMEYIQGEPIDVWCNQRRLSLRDRIELVRQLVEAVEHAHQRLIIHRDIKPANVLVSADGKVTLVDFGVAKSIALAAAQSSTVTAERFLTPRTAAPEQLAGGAVGTACDIHGLGLLLYVLLCGREPYDFETRDPLRMQEQLLRIPAPAMATRIAGAQPGIANERGLRTVTELQSALRGDIEQVVLRCLRKRPEERYASVGELDRDLRSLLEGRPISERENEHWYRLRKFILRHRTSFALASVAVVLLFAALFVVLHQQQRTVHERDRAESAISLLRESFAAANPLSTKGAQTPISEVLDAALPLLEAQRQHQPELYADLAATMAQVELAAGRPQQALELSNKAIAASAHAGLAAREVHVLRLLRARAALESGELHELVTQLQDLVPATLRESIEIDLMRGRLAYLQGNPKDAVQLLDATFEAAAGLPETDPLALDVRLYRAQARRQAGDIPQAITLLDETLALLARHFKSDHPRILITRMRRLEYVRHVQAAQEVLPEVLALEGDIERAFGQRSALLARVRGTLAQIYLDMDDKVNATRHFRLSWQGWQAAASAGHLNALRSLFNLAYTMGTTDADAEEVDRLFRRLFEDAADGSELNPGVTTYWRISHLEFLVGRQRCAQALTGMQEYFDTDTKIPLNTDTRTLLDQVLNDTLRTCACDARGPADKCAPARRVQARIASENDSSKAGPAPPGAQ